MDEADWGLLQTRFCQNAADATDPEWDNSPHLFYDKKSDFGYNMKKLNGLNKSTTKIIADHNNGDAEKLDYSEANGLMDKLYLAVGAEVMLTSNLWVSVGFHNGYKVKVVYFV